MESDGNGVRNLLTVGSGEERVTISIVLWWVMLKENCAPHVMVSPFGMWGILTEWGRNEVLLPRRKLGIGMTGHTGGGAPAINALAGTIGGYIGDRALVGTK